MNTTPRDIDVSDWLDGIGFHPADTEAKQLGHQAARNLIAQLGMSLAQLLPAGRDKSLVFTHLEDVLMRANRALALGGGPQDVTDDLRRMAAAGYAPTDPRIDEYEATQRGEAVQEPLPDDFGAHEYDATVTTDDPEIKVNIHSSTASARVQVAVLCTNPQRVEEAFTEGGGTSGNFDGFYAGFTAPDQLSAFLREVHEAGSVAFQ